MKVTRELVLTVVLVAAVLLIGIAMFAFAGQEMSDEARAATTWSNALCEGDMDTLLRMAAVDVEADVFAGWTANFLASGEIPQPCTARVNLNLVRAVPVPDSLRGSIDRVRLFGEVAFTGTRGQVMTMPLWLYHTIGGEWKVWAGYFGATPEQGADPGELARLTDRNGLLIGMARVIPPVRTFQAENRTLVAVEMSLQTLSQPWEWYGTQLLADGRLSRPVENADQLPDEWRAGFANANGGGYVPQNLEQIVTFWFAADAAQPSPDLTLTFTAQVPNSGTLKATYFDLSAEARANLETFNPFRAVAPLSDPARVAFAGEINMASFPGDRLWLECNRIVAITADGAWRPATNCGFPNGNGQAFLPGDHLRTTLYFDGFEGLHTSDIVRVDYRRTESIVAIRQTLWQAAQ